MAHKDIWLRDGTIPDLDVMANFAMCRTDDGKFTYWGYDPRVLTFEQAAQKLEDECKTRGLQILPK